MLDKKNEDHWQWDGKETLIRIHKTPRRQNFVPQDCEDCPCDPRIICDERETEQKFKTNTRVIKDIWRFKGDNHESTNKLNEFWTGKSTFKVLANAEVIDRDKSYKVSQGVITLCTNCNELNTIPVTDVFVPYQYHIEVSKCEVDHPKVSVILWREKKNRTLEFQFSKSPCDLMTSKFAKFSLAINLIEVPRAVPCFVLLCSEERNWFTFLQNKMKDEMKFHVVPITEDDDMLSPYGISKARRCLRTKLDSVFFAGPCTGGSPWNRINRWVSEATTQLIEAKKQIFWAMWEVFASVLSELINMGSPALLELPRGCDYWKDRRMTDLVEGTVSHEHKFDGCMYGLKSQFQETPKPIKKPWKIVTWGVSFPKLHRRCDRRHDHVECAGRETRITQAYTKWIAKIIMNGINDHVIRNSPFVNVKVMKRWKPLAFDEQLKAEMSRDSENVRSHPIKSVATSVCATRELDAIDHSFEQSLLHWCLSRLTSASVLSSWHLSFSCQPLSEFDSDWLLRVLRSVQLFPLFELLSRDLRSVRLTSVQSEMAETNDMNSLGQFSSNRITIAQRVLKGSSEGTIAAKAPPPFRDTRGANYRLLSSEDIANQWIRFGMPPAVVYSAYFANTRYTNEATAEALEVAYKLLQRSQDTEKKCSGWEFISKGSRFVKVFANRCPHEDAMMGRFMDKEIYDRLDELWIVLSKGHFPEPFDDRISAAESEAKIRNMKQRFRGTPSFNTDPSATSWLAVTRTAEYFKVMDELTKVNPKSPSDNDSYLKAVKHMVEVQMRHLGHALRYHNEQNPSNQIILQDVMKDVIAFETNQPRGRSAAQNHFLCLLALGTTVERHKTSARGDGNLAKIAILSEIQFSIVKAFDIPLGILIGQGYNVSIADEGARYTEKERRHACHSSLKDFTTTMTETQGGTGGDMHNFDNWDVPLTFNDGRLPNEVDFWNNEEPSWIHDDTSTGPSAQSASSPPEGPQPQASQQPQGSTIQPKKMPRSSTGGGASSSTHAAFRSGPGTTPQDQAEPERGENWTPTEDWMKRRKPSTVEVRLHAAEDYAHQEQRIAFLRSGRDFVLSTIEGPHTTHKYGTNLIWKQYLRRLTFHAALSFNMLTEGQLDSHMINESDYEWLKLYHHIITSTEFVRCKGYPVTEVLAMLTLGIEDTVEGEIRNKLKKLGSKIGQFIIGKPWMDRWDELGGQVRNNKALILTDLTYQTRSSSRIVNDIEAGLNNMGLSSIKVYQLPYESLEKPEEFLKLATNALTFLRTNTATFTSVTIHIWISFASLFRGQNRMLVPNADFVVKLAGIITEISQEAPSNFCQHSERRPVSWVPIIDCIHRRGVRKNIERKGHHALHQWEILETDLCVWTRAFLLERWWRQGSHLGHAWKVTDATEGLLTLCHGSWYSTWPEWRVCPCEEHRIWHRDHQTMHRTSSNHSQHSYWRHKRCSSWIGKHHWRNEPYEGFSPEKSMVRYPTRSIHPGAPDRCGWALGRSDRRFRTDVRRVQRFSSEWFPNEHMHGESHKMSALRKQLDKIGNLRNWSHWDGWIFTGCTSSCKVAQHLQRMCWLEKHGSRKGPSWILDHGNSCNALRIQNDQRRAQAGITSRCHPHARIHGEGKMQARPVATIHCATWNTNGGVWRWHTQNPMVLQTALGRWKRCLSWLHEDGINQGRDRINVQSNGDSWVHRRHFRILAWDAWPWHSISYNVWWMGGKPW